MVKAIIDIPESTNHILNIIKAKYNLKDKSEAISKMAELINDEVLELKLKPEVKEKIEIDARDYIQ
ncbi:MAG: DUF2683 family protein [Nanoarchaeota archaeon]|nr:DUF2683 family protein [Nanoarchaeota archaeon]MBU0962604.1 DUF2683 family protein [Nanoarchaeota archaeon]